MRELPLVQGELGIQILLQLGHRLDLGDESVIDLSLVVLALLRDLLLLLENEAAKALR